MWVHICLWRTLEEVDTRNMLQVPRVGERIFLVGQGYKVKSVDWVDEVDGKGEPLVGNQQVYLYCTKDK